jgi:hypothetical protein
VSKHGQNKEYYGQTIFACVFYIKLYPENFVLGKKYQEFQNVKSMVLKKNQA